MKRRRSTHVPVRREPPHWIVLVSLILASFGAAGIAYDTIVRLWPL